MSQTKPVIIAGDFEDGSGSFLIEGISTDFSLTLAESNPSDEAVRSLGFANAFKEQAGVTVGISTAKFYHVGLTWSKLPEDLSKSISVCRLAKNVFPERSMELMDVATNLETYGKLKTATTLFTKFDKLAVLLDEQVAKAIRRQYG